jgi:hypothetical protein
MITSMTPLATLFHRALCNAKQRADLWKESSGANLYMGAMLIPIVPFSLLTQLYTCGKVLLKLHITMAEMERVRICFSAESRWMVQTDLKQMPEVHS